MALRLRHSLKLGLRGIVANSLRSLLTALGIVLGVASVIAMLSVGEGGRHEALKQLADLGANTIILKSVKPAEDTSEKKGADLFAYGITYSDFDRIRETIPTIVSATPSRSFSRSFHVHERKMEGRLVSVTPNFFLQNQFKIVRGRGFEDVDEEKYEPVAIIGSSTADTLFPTEDPIGKAITISTLTGLVPFTIIGVTEDKRLALGDKTSGDNEYARVVFIPFSTDRVRLGREIISLKNGYSVERLDISQLTLNVAHLKDVPSTAKVLESLIDQYHPMKDVQVFVPLDLLQKAEATQRLFTLILASIAGISLVVGGIGIMNIMLASITERTREIGIRRALGAKKSDIALQFLVETVTLSCGGGLIGVGVGISISYALKTWASTPTILTAWAPIVAFSTSVVVGLASGLYPARRAANLDPIEALRHT